MAMEKFPWLEVPTLSHSIQVVFPSTTRKRRGKSRATYVVGMEAKVDLPSTSDVMTSDLMSSSDTCYEAATSPASCAPAIPSAESMESAESLDSVVAELERERERRTALEQEVSTLEKKLERQSQHSPIEGYKQSLVSEIDAVVCSKQVLVHGPDTVDSFDKFSIRSIIDELRDTCPEVYSLIQQLGSTQRYSMEDGISGEELKGVMAICTLLNARSARVKGLQLMISLMLVARAAGRQVCHLTTHAIIMHV